MRDFYELTIQRKNRLKIPDFLYHFTPFLKLAAIGLFGYALSLKGSLSYIFIATSVFVFLSSVLLNYIRQKMLYDFRYTYDKINDRLLIEKAYYKIKAGLIAELPLSSIIINNEMNQNNACYFEDNTLEYVITLSCGNNNYTIAIDTYMYALITQRML